MANAVIEKSVKDRLDDVKLRTVVENIFFGTFTYLPLQVTKAIPTGATNGKKFLFNPDFVAKQSDRSLYGLYLHEVCHVALGHHLRRGDREPKTWNVACDYSINQILTQYGYVLPDGALLSEKYQGMSAEQIYAKIKERGGPTGHEEEEGLKGRVDDIPTEDKPRKKGKGKTKKTEEKKKTEETEDQDGGEDSGKEAEDGDLEGDFPVPVDGEGDGPESDQEGEGKGKGKGKGESESTSQGGGSADDEEDDEEPADEDTQPDGDWGDGEPEEEDDDEDAGDYGDDPYEDEEDDEDGEILDRSDDLKTHAQEVADWTVKVCQAEALARGAGEVPEALTQEIASQKEGKAPWTAILQDALTRIAEEDFSYAKPNKLFSHSGIIHPGPWSEELGTLVVAVDTSGSTWDQSIMDRLAAEVGAIITGFNFQEVHVISCDSVIQHVDVLLPGQPLEFKPYGGGGTDVIPVFRYIEDKQLDPAALVYLTDLDFYRFPKTEPSYKVVWGAVNAPRWYRQRVPFGQVVDIDTYAKL